MAKTTHEIRDPIHVFVRLDSDERRVLDSAPLQRLRHIHQLALTHLLYPGATHRRFEHSLGVMELAGRVFDVVTNPRAINAEVRETLKEITDEKNLLRWRFKLRLAALCHDIGHLPFSHAAEKELLPDKWSHERLTCALIKSPQMSDIWNLLDIRPDDIVKLSISHSKAKDIQDSTDVQGATGLQYSTWETILSEIITGDAFGVDRMDYLLRDSYHTGVAYGKFDHYRLVDTLRILPTPPGENTVSHNKETNQGSQPEDHKSKKRPGDPALGIEEGGLLSAEAMLLARYFMYSQVYLHPIRRIYDVHLKDFLRDWLPDSRFSTDVSEHLKYTDNEIMSAIWEAAHDPTKCGHDAARRIIQHRHFRLLYQRNPIDVERNAEVANMIFEEAKAQFGADNVRRDVYSEKGSATEFPVLQNDGQVVPSLSISSVLQHIPIAKSDYTFIERERMEDAEKWLKREKQRILDTPLSDTPLEDDP